MSIHFSDNQFTQGVLGQATSAELQHLRECPACRAELDRAQQAIGSFRNTVRGRVDRQMATQPPAIPIFSEAGPTHRAVTPKWQWALLTATAVMLVLVPLYISEKEPPQRAIPNSTLEADPETLMRTVDFHLSQTIPAPMEPLLSLLPQTDSGGSQ